ncbi:hypothetical protein EVG20_g8451 [Dentipellis fragilis]|uniref:SGNH hydrolase-type esterase domain-containing protein n=1 Tax=Dentipellis fragilis TaxID=205917 RepID=A0A4Y9Y7B4_9AGAM|nr:hypothetical protein EVG20_g8451 [Dentipellis fragilis]
MPFLALFTVVAILMGDSSLADASPTASSSIPVNVRNDDPLIYYHGRWDRSPGTWWAGSGFKLNVDGLSSLVLTLGPHTTSPNVSIGVSVDYGPFNIVNMSAGNNVVPLTPVQSDADENKPAHHVVRINAQQWQDNRVNLESITLNAGAKLSPYEPSKLAFQFIGDSLSADILSYGNVHGVSYQFFRTEDTGYYYTTDHNYTTPWNFARDRPAATHVVIHIGANDSAQNVTADAFVDTYLKFINKLRTIYTHQPIFVFTPWGWPQPDGSISQYYEVSYTKIVDSRHAAGDSNVFLVNTTGWVTLQDVFADNLHPTVDGHMKIASFFEHWLQNWGLKPEKHASILALLTRLLRSLSARRAASSRSVSRPCLEDARVMSDPTDVAEVPNDEYKCARDGRERRFAVSSSRRYTWWSEEDWFCEETESSRCIVGGRGARVSEATEYRELALSEDDDAAASENGDINFPGIEWVLSPLMSFFASSSISGVNEREGSWSPRAGALTCRQQQLVRAHLVQRKC